MTIITRFPPSPTWYLHIWSLRTVLYNYLYAKQNKWKFILRIEDTDRTRYVDGSIENMTYILDEMWLSPDEWPNNPWKVWPYKQSERLEIYKKYVKELIKNWNAYYCFCSSERLDKLRQEQQEVWLPTKYDWKCRHLSEEEIKEKLESWIDYTIRLKVPKNKEVVFEDKIRWKIIVNSKDIDDQVLMKSDWFPTYHLANVIDDHLMWITDVIRWEEWTPSTPKHILLYEAFWWEIPNFYHIPLLLWNDKKKLSKRTWDVAVEKYLENWYLVEALLNYIALLWWNPKTTEEFFSMEELIKKFDLSKVHKAWAIFDIERLNFFNSHYLKSIKIEDLYEKLLKYLKKYDNEFYEKITKFDKDYNLKILEELKTRIKRFDEFKEFSNFFYENPKIPSSELILNEKMKVKDFDIVKKWIQLALDILSANNWGFNSIDDIKNAFVEKINNLWLKNWQVLWPIRAILSWEQFSPWALEMIYILWSKKSTERLNNYLKTID